MRITKALLSLMAVGLAAVIVPALPSARIFQCLQGVELGMSASGVRETLKATVSEDEVIEMGDGFSTALRDSNLFRHARYRFDDKGALAQIELTIREVRGREKVIGELDRTYKINLSDEAVVLRDGMVLTLEGNTVIIKNNDPRTAKTHAKRGPTR